MSALRFAAVGLNHNHIYGQVNCLLRAGAELVAFHAVEDDLAAEFTQAFRQAKRVADKRAVIEDPSIALIASAAICGCGQSVPQSSRSGLARSNAAWNGSASG